MVGDMKGIQPQKLCFNSSLFIDVYGWQEKWVGYSLLYLVGNPICLQETEW